MTPVERLQAEFGLYLQEERALSSRTQFCYLIFVREFLKERFGNRSVDLSCSVCSGCYRIRAASRRHHSEQASPDDDYRL